MTLLITLGNKRAIHQSSDYRLSCQGVSTETANGTKQLSAGTRAWTAKIAFTGIGSDGQGYITQNWLYEEAVSLSQASDPASFVKKLAQRGTKELKRVTNYCRRLSIVVAVATVGECRLFLISNFEEPRKKPLGYSLDALCWFEYDLDLSSPLWLVNGAPRAVPKSKKRVLEMMFRRNAEPKDLRARIANANRVAASRREYDKIISQGCWVNSIFADGHSDGENYGDVQGIPYNIISGFDMSGWLQNSFRPEPGKAIGLRQSFSFVGRVPVPLPAEAEEPRMIRFSTPTTSLQGIGQTPGSEFPRLVIAGLSSTVELRKNVQVRALVNMATFEIDPSSEDAGGPLAIQRVRLSNVPTVDRAQPRMWEYVFDLHIGGGTAVLTICPSSVALRSTNCKTGLDSLGPNEELVLSAPAAQLMLTASRDLPRASAEIPATFLLRDFAD